MARRFTEDERAEIWHRLAVGESGRAVAKSFGRFPSAIYAVQHATGGVRPGERRRREDALTLAEREEISRGLASKESYVAIAGRLGRAPSTICREVQRNAGRARYRACGAERRALRAVLRPKPAKLSQCPRLRAVVEAKLALKWSSQQIARWLPTAYPADPEMRVSHETIYLSLYVQSRGALRYELHRALRTGRAVRRAKK